MAGIETILRSTAGHGVPTVFCHGNPTSSSQWIPFMEALGAPALALDMPNFGAAERLPPARFAAGMDDYAAWIGAALDELAGDRFRLVVHDWGAVALIPAIERAARVDRLVVIDSVPLLPGYRWHWMGRIWRRRGAGEAFNAMASRPVIALLLRQARPRFERAPAELVDPVAAAWDRGLSDAILRLYRSADPDRLAAAGAGLARLDCPALVVWGHADRFVGPELGPRYAAALPGAELLEVEGAGHWPWLDRPDVITRVCAFLRAEAR